MTHSIRASFRAAFLLFFGLTLTAQEKENKPEKCFLWSVKSGQATLYLLGSMHVADEGVYPLDPTIETAFKNSDLLVVEINLTKVNHAKLNLRVVQKGLYQGDETLEKNLSKETLDKLKDFLKKRGLPLAALNKQRPWLASLTLTMQEIVKLGYRRELGIDQHFRDKANEQKKEILELETPEGQLDALSSHSEKLQELLLLSTIEEFSDAKEMMARMLVAWKRGDAGEVNRLIRSTAVENSELRPLMKVVFDDRNARMVENIATYLKTDRTYFMVVGAGHMVGDKGIVSLLRDKGLAVRQMTKAPVKTREKAAAGTSSP